MTDRVEKQALTQSGEHAHLSGALKEIQDHRTAVAAASGKSSGRSAESPQQLEMTNPFKDAGNQPKDTSAAAKPSPSKSDSSQNPTNRAADAGNQPENVSAGDQSEQKKSASKVNPNQTDANGDKQASKMEDPNKQTPFDIRNNFALRNPSALNPTGDAGTDSLQSGQKSGGNDGLPLGQRQPQRSSFDPSTGPELAAIKKQNVPSIIKE